MGHFYTNLTVRTSDSSRVTAALRAAGHRAFLSPPEAGAIVVYPEATESQDGRILDQVAALLSDRCNCAVLAVLNHDDDILYYSLFERGRQIDTYDSTPDYYDQDAPAEPTGGDAALLCAAFGVPDQAASVANILVQGTDEEEGYLFAWERHDALVRALGLPSCAVGFGHRDLVRGRRPDSLQGEMQEIQAST
jgi:hypothetical protein